MAEALAVEVTVIGVAAVAWSSAKALYDVVSDYRDAPKALQDLGREVKTVLGLLESLSEHLKSQSDSDLSEQQRFALEDLKEPLEGTKQACDALKSLVQSIMSHSDSGQMSKKDRLDLMFRDKDVNRRKIELLSYQVTLNAALGLITLKSKSDNQEELRKYEAETAASLSDIKGQIQGMQMTLQYLGLSNDDLAQPKVADQFVKGTEADAVLEVLNEHDRALKQCLKFLINVYQGVNTNSGTGISVLNSQTMDEAWQFIGNIGDIKNLSPIYVDGLVGSGNSKVIVGNISHEAARDFWKEDSSTFEHL